MNLAIRRLTAGAAAVFSIALLSYWMKGTDHDGSSLLGDASAGPGHAEAEAGGHPEERRPKSSKSYGYDVGAISSWREPGFSQNYLFVNHRDVVIADMTLNPSTQDWDVTHYRGSTSYDILCGNSNGQDYFYLAGEATNGDLVVEQWRLKAKLNNMGPGSPPGGTVVKTIKRTEIYRGVVGKTPISLGVDPESRFLLVLAGTELDRTVYSFEVSVNSPLTVWNDISNVPELGNVSSINRFNHAALGRIWEFTGEADLPGSDGGQVIIFVDSDNDGAFEPPPIIDSYHVLAASGLYDLSQWSSLNRGP